MHPTRPSPGLAGPLPALIVASALAAAPRPAAAQEPVPLTRGMVVTASTRIAPGVYDVPGSPDLDEALIVVRGSDVELDLRGVTLRGIPTESDPDLAAGVAIRIDGGERVTVRGATLRGYRFAILARGTRDLRLLDNELSYNWKPRLFSQVGHESLVDWLSFHDNEDRQWMRFGAAVYLEDVTRGELRGNRMVQGMNGMLLTRTDSVLVMDNDASYNSGLGIGLYRSSANLIVHNRFDYDVRGYQPGFYRRGQDSAGILLYEQSSDNLVAFNSATHSGDGFFLWAGNSTMDTGQGGANDNLLLLNDFSYAPTNAVEVTFSRNRIVANYLRSSRYGVWGGYSWETLVRGNCFGGNVYGVAIEHGQDNRIVGNAFEGDSLAISLWARESQPADWGYPRHRDVRSRGYVIEHNGFWQVAERWHLERTGDVTFGHNGIVEGPLRHPCHPSYLIGPDEVARHVRESLERIRAGGYGQAADRIEALDPGSGGSLVREPAIPSSPGRFLPAAAVVVDAWGPWDGRSPKLWPADTTRLEVPLRVLGPPGEWRVAEQVGIREVSAMGGRIAEGRRGLDHILTVTPAPGRWRDWSVTLEYRGAEDVVTPRGTVIPAGTWIPFSFERFEPATDWHVDFFTWDDAARDPEADPGAFEALLAGAPAFSTVEHRLDYQWFTPQVEGLPQERWALVAEGEVVLPPGETWSLRTISDDGIRVWVDGALVIDRFDPHGSEVDYAEIAPGRHDLRVVYYQLGGWSEVRVDVVRGAARSEGSAGPH